MVGLGHEVKVVQQMRAGPQYELDGVTVYGRPKLHLVNRADVVVSHCGDNGAAHVAALKAGIPSVRIAHQPPPSASIDRAAAVICTSHATARGIPGSIVCRPPTVREDHETTRGHAVTLVNLSKEKGGALFDLIAASMPDREFLGVTGGYGRQTVPKSPNVTVIPTTADMRDVWSRTRLLLMPSARESWGMVGIEAACSGIPTIAHPCDGLRESLGDAGIFVDRNDLAGWVRAIEALDSPDAYTAASDRARAQVPDFTGDLDLFANTIESLVSVPA